MWQVPSYSSTTSYGEPTPASYNAEWNVPQMQYSFSNTWSPVNPNTSTSKFETPSNFVQVSGNYGWNTANNQQQLNQLNHIASKPINTPKKPPVSSTIEEEISGQNLYKTELCRSYEDTGSCRYGTKCQFAHGKAELRPVLRHPKYKTEVCKTFYNAGTCPYGRRCRFIHSTTLVVPDSNVQLNSSTNGSHNQTISQSTDSFNNSNDYANSWDSSPISMSPSSTSSSSPVESTPSWIEAMGSLSISPSSELVQLVVPEQATDAYDAERNKKSSRLSFFESITNGQ